MAPRGLLLHVTQSWCRDTRRCESLWPRAVGGGTLTWCPGDLPPTVSISVFRTQLLGADRVASRFMVQPFLLHLQCQRDAPQELSVMPVLGLPAPDPWTREMPWAPVWRCGQVSVSVALMHVSPHGISHLLPRIPSLRCSPCSSPVDTCLPVRV
ncbi:unnamed protein product [Rangifer tarandus platyrhynchus]|uniref:Uncharacterized protein n=1 Tax=Rangifer tarandus platyrhynchus TaxID=3082113 RepID=A0AC59Y3X3_RANTA